MLRQVPYSCIKLSSYDVISEQLMTLLTAVKSKWSDRAALSAHEEPRVLQIAPPALLTAAEEKEIHKPMGVQISSGIFAGVFAAVLSQPQMCYCLRLRITRWGHRCCLVYCSVRAIRHNESGRRIRLEGMFRWSPVACSMVSTMTAVQF